MINLSDDEASVEVQADIFASTLLMPLDDFRGQTPSLVDFEVLGAAAERYGVSLTAVILQWLKHTHVSALLVVHRDGYVKWAFSSKTAFRNGAFIRTRDQGVPIPKGSLAVNADVSSERHGIELPATIWFPHAPADTSIHELKISSDQYDWVMTLILLPRGLTVWKPREL
jgi:hypothetical protein